MSTSTLRPRERDALIQSLRAGVGHPECYTSNYSPLGGLPGEAVPRKLRPTEACNLEISCALEMHFVG